MEYHAVVTGVTPPPPGRLVAALTALVRGAGRQQQPCDEQQPQLQRQQQNAPLQAAQQLHTAGLDVRAVVAIAWRHGCYLHAAVPERKQQYEAGETEAEFAPHEQVTAAIGNTSNLNRNLTESPQVESQLRLS